MKIPVAVFAVVAASLVAGCGSQRDNGASGSEASASVSPSAAASEPSEPTTSPSPPTRPRPKAADGSRYAACADGTCEVYVTRPVRIKVRGGTFSVTKVKPNDSMDFKLRFSAGGGGSGTLKGTCGGIATFYRGGGIRTVTCDASGVPKRPAREPGALSLQLAGWSSSGAAVLRLVSG